jgi:hypothetical protein
VAEVERNDDDNADKGNDEHEYEQKDEDGNGDEANERKLSTCAGLIRDG